MNTKQKSIFANIFPYLIMGVGITLIIGFMFVFFYIIVWGVIIGSILWLAAVIRNHFFPKKAVTKSKGRIIEYKHKE